MVPSKNFLLSVKLLSSWNSRSGEQCESLGYCWAFPALLVIWCMKPTLCDWWADFWSFDTKKSEKTSLHGMAIPVLQMTLLHCGKQQVLMLCCAFITFNKAPCSSTLDLLSWHIKWILSLVLFLVSPHVISVDLCCHKCAFVSMHLQQVSKTRFLWCTYDHAQHIEGEKDIWGTYSGKAEPVRIITNLITKKI